MKRLRGIGHNSIIRQHWKGRPARSLVFTQHEEVSIKKKPKKGNQKEKNRDTERGRVHQGRNGGGFVEKKRILPASKKLKKKKPMLERHR